MAANSDEDKWEHSGSQEQEEEEEALSLCDLPVGLIRDKNQTSKEEDEDEEEEDHQESEKAQEDFKFGQWDDESEMCAADDIFFKGQILPFRLSVSSESALSLKHSTKQETWTQPNRVLSRSESMDHCSSGFTSFSSRSSSCRSQISSSSTNTSNSFNARKKTSNPIIQTQFHTQPSPKPQIKHSKSSLGSATSNRSRKSSTVWDFIRLGLVRTPEIELQDLKIRASVSRNSSSSSSSNSNNNIKIGSKNEGKKQEQRKQSFLEQRSNLLSGCDCRVSAVKPVALNTINLKSSTSTGTNTNANNNNNNNNNSTLNHSTKKKKKKRVKKSQENQRRKQTMSRHRTFEWIKELSSHASFVDHDS